MGTVDIKICSFIILSCFFLPLTNLNGQQESANAFYYASEIVCDSKGNLFVSKIRPIQPGVQAGIKGQVFLTFRNGALMD